MGIADLAIEQGPHYKSRTLKYVQFAHGVSNVLMDCRIGEPERMGNLRVAKP